jgi:signal transduction histidine kinase
MNTPEFPMPNRVLVIDDNQAVRADFKKILQPEDEGAADLDAAGAKLFGPVTGPAKAASVELDEAPSGEEGLKLVQAARAEGRPYVLAFVDVRMAPGWDGIETTARIFQRDPDIQIVICTAYSDYSWEEMIARLGQSDRLVILKKPFDTVEVLQLTHALAEKWRLGQKARARMDQLEAMVATRTAELQTALTRLKEEMAEHARTEENLRQAQKMEAVGQLAGGIAHDFNNLLTIIRGYTQHLMAELNPGRAVMEALREIDAAAERAAKLTGQMLLFSRKQRMQPRSIHLNEVINQFDTMLRRSLGEHITLEIQTGQVPLTIRADPVMMEMAVLNLAVNARDAMPRGGKLLITAGLVEITGTEGRNDPKARPGRFVRLSVEDSGCGITADVRPHLFEPFFTTKETGKGTGLGLATVYGIVKQHEGWIEVESEPDRGTRFNIFLPVEIQPGRPAAPAPALRPDGGHETILLVEDEAPLRRLAKQMLQRHGYRVFDACSGVEALAVWKERQAEIDLLLTDMIMPGGWTGLELADKIRADKNNLRIIYSTGYSPDAFSPNLHLKEGVNFLAKPYHPNLLIQTVRNCLDLPAQAESQNGKPEGDPGHAHSQ